MIPPQYAVDRSSKEYEPLPVEQQLRGSRRELLRGRK
jgi:hypothetical protein